MLLKTEVKYIERLKKCLEDLAVVLVREEIRDGFIAKQSFKILKCREFFKDREPSI